jgi:hypothetical protein
MKDILLLNKSDFSGYHNEELLANLEGCQDINFGTTINMPTNLVFEGNTQSNVMNAFNAYLRHLSRTVSRIIIT